MQYLLSGSGVQTLPLFLWWRTVQLLDAPELALKGWHAS